MFGHQYCGNVGKTANSQVAVMACLSNGDFASMVDARLYLPRIGVMIPMRCEKAGIPEQERGFKTKIELAEEIGKRSKFVKRQKEHYEVHSILGRLNSRLPMPIWYSTHWRLCLFTECTYT